MDLPREGLAQYCREPSLSQTLFATPQVWCRTRSGILASASGGACRAAPSWLPRIVFAICAGASAVPQAPANRLEFTGRRVFRSSSRRRKFKLRNLRSHWRTGNWHRSASC